jgi:hypothetical protein
MTKRQFGRWKLVKTVNRYIQVIWRWAKGLGLATE